MGRRNCHDDRTRSDFGQQSRDDGLSLWIGCDADRLVSGSDLVGTAGRHPDGPACARNRVRYLWHKARELAQPARVTRAGRALGSQPRAIVLMRIGLSTTSAITAATMLSAAAT